MLLTMVFVRTKCFFFYQNMPQQPGVVALWNEQSKVEVFDLRPSLSILNRSSLDRSGGVVDCNPSEEDLAPKFTFHGHPIEGFALGWSPVETGRLASGDCQKNIHVWEPLEQGEWAVGGPYAGHTDSVEDIQWSPTESGVFASCSVVRFPILCRSRCAHTAYTVYLFSRSWHQALGQLLRASCRTRPSRSGTHEFKSKQP